MDKPDDKPRHEAWALCRYQVISAYLAMEPGRGQRRALLEQLAARSWSDPDGEPFQVAAETIRVWVRRYRKRGLAGLQDKPRSDRGHSAALSEALVAKICALRREVPERSLDRIIRILEQSQTCEPGTVARSTVHRALRKHGLSARACKVPDRHDLDRFEAAFPNDLWQSDMLVGPWLPDPERPGKSRRAKLFAFLDDHSRKLLFGRFAFAEDLPTLELVFRRSLQRFGVPRRVYYDNGQVYRSGHMHKIVASLGIHRIIFTQPRRPMGHGKIEALNRHIRSAFVAELKASRITTLDELNEAFLAWADLEYNQLVHGETGQKPDERWRAGLERVRYADERLLDEAFTWSELRTPDKAGVFSLFGVRYQAGAELAKRRVEVRYDPEALDQVEVYRNGEFVQRAKTLEVRPHRRPRARRTDTVDTETKSRQPTVDYLDLLTQRRRDAFLGAEPRQQAATRHQQRQEADRAVIDLLDNELDAAVVDHEAITAFLERHGPFDLEPARRAVTAITATGRRDQHVAFYLDAIRNLCRQGQP